MAKSLDSLRCPDCGSVRLYRAGLRYLSNGETIQRWLCRNCGFRFSESSVKGNVAGKISETFDSKKNYHKIRVTSRNASIDEVSDSLPFFFGEDVAPHNLSIAEKDLNNLPFYNSKHQVCASNKKAKNLDSTTKTKTVVETESQRIQDIRGKIIELAWMLKKEGYNESTIKSYSVMLQSLARKGANLLDPENIKEIIANMEVTTTTKRNYSNAYDKFIKTVGLKWKKPRYRPARKLPHIPIESDIDQLIVGSGKKLGTVLQIAKETAMRIGEVLRLEWTDIDTERNLITLNGPEKGSNPGIYKVSTQLISRIMALPKKSERIFPTSVNSISVRLRETRKKLAQKLQNPRLLKITFHSLRHWKATMLYHKLKDPFYVRDFLRHKDIRNTTIYINIERSLFQSTDNDEFTVKVAKNLQEVCELLKVGFEYVTEINSVKVFRKRK